MFGASKLAHFKIAGATTGQADGLREIYGTDDPYNQSD
jgi:hypothetical protein